MGLGDNIMATGMAKGAKARGKRIAFGDGKQIVWDHHSEQIFRNNPNIVPPGFEKAGDIEWIPFYRGNRLYNKERHARWAWNYDFKPIPGELYLTEDELKAGRKHGSGFVVIEPNLPEFKTSAPNKKWPLERYQKVVRLLAKSGLEISQLAHGGSRFKIENARQIKTNSIREGFAVLKNAALYIGPEGGLHHAAAAASIPAVVLFGGFIPPQVTGYDTHINLTGGAEACGSLRKCAHCESAMLKITVPEVCDAAHSLLKVAE